MSKFEIIIQSMMKIYLFIVVKISIIKILNNINRKNINKIKDKDKNKKIE